MSLDSHRLLPFPENNHAERKFPLFSFCRGHGPDPWRKPSRRHFRKPERISQWRHQPALSDHEHRKLDVRHKVGTAVKPHIPMDRRMLLIAFAFAAAWTVTGAMAVHLPRILELAGATSIEAIAAGTLIGPAQVAARIARHLAFLRQDLAQSQVSVRLNNSSVGYAGRDCRLLHGVPHSGNMKIWGF